MLKARISKKKLAAIILSILYAVILAYYFPIDGSIVDRLSYVTYANSSDIIIQRYIDLSLIANEPIWLLINIFLKSIFSTENTVRLVIGIPAFITSYLILSRHLNAKSFLLLFIFLTFPFAIKNHIIHLRQGVAIAVFTIGWYSNKSRNRWLFYLATPLIHASFFFILPLLFFSERFEKFKFSVNLNLTILFLLSITPILLSNNFANLIGSRQGGKYLVGNVEDVSGINFFIFLLIFLLFIYQGKIFVTKNIFSISLILFYLSAYFISGIAGRVFESGILIILLTGLSIKNYKLIFIAIITTYTILLYFNRIGSPYLGWGTGL